jgi:hypothetical protein
MHCPGLAFILSHLGVNPASLCRFGVFCFGCVVKEVKMCEAYSERLLEGRSVKPHKLYPNSKPVNIKE